MSTLLEAYKALGFESVNVTMDSIRSRYRRLRGQYHPDNKETGNRKMFEAMEHYYLIITNTEYRMKHMPRTYRDDLNIVVQIEITFDEAFRGAYKEIRYYINRISLDSEVIDLSPENYRTAKIELMPGDAFLNSTLTIPGAGAEHSGVKGDLVIKWVVNEHHLGHTCDGTNVRSVEKIPAPILMYGGSYPINTMYGDVDYDFHASWEGSVVRIPNKGVNKSGYHEAVIIPKIPSEDDLNSLDVIVLIEKYYGVNLI